MNLIVGQTDDNVGEGIIRVSLLASGINNKNFSLAENDGENQDKSNIFLKPRLVSNRQELIKSSETSNKLNHKQSDLEDFLAKESGELNKNILEEESLNIDDTDKDFFIPEEEASLKKRVGEKIDPFKEADLLNANLAENKSDETKKVDSSGSLISRLSTVKNKAINVGTKAFSMVSEVANKSFDSKEENKEDETNKSEDYKLENTLELNQDRIEPSFIESNEDKTIKGTYDNTFDRVISDDDNMNIPSFLRRNKD